MTINVTLAPVADLTNTVTAKNTINANSTAIHAGFATSLNIEGDTMYGTLDMNSNRIINLPAPATATEPLRLGDVEDADLVVIATIREKLITDRTYWVSPTGSDDNDGLTATNPFKTIQKAVDAVAAIDIGGFNVVIQLSDGTHSNIASGGIILKETVGYSTLGCLKINGNETNPGSVIVTDSINAEQITQTWSVQNLKFSNPASGYSIGAFKGSIAIGNLVFSGVGSTGIVAADLGNVFVLGAQSLADPLRKFTVDDPTPVAFIYETGNCYVDLNNSTITYLQSPAFSFANLFVDTNSTLEVYNMVYVNAGTVTGRQYQISSQSQIITLGAEIIPGSKAGVALDVSQKDGVPAFRPQLTANRTYYVRTDGSDSNDGLANTAAGAFATFAKAIATIATIDGGGFNVTIQGNNATHTNRININIPFVGINSLFIDLAGGTISVADTCLLVLTQPVFGVYLSNMTLTSSGNNCLTIGQGVYVEIDTGVTFGTSGNNHIDAGFPGSVCYANGGYTITGGAVNHISCGAPSAVVYIPSTVTVSGTPNFTTAFANVSDLGVINAFGGTFSGSATGKRYTVVGNGVADTVGGGANFFPGDVAGTTATGGQYI